MSRPPLRSVPSALDAGWFTQVFQHLGHDVVIESVTSAPVGTGQSAHSERFNLNYSTWDERAPRSLVAKLPAPDPTSRATGHVHGSYAREAGFYRELQPTLSVPVPECIYLDFDPSDSDFVLLLQDMAPASQGDQMAGCSLPEARAAVLTAASLHAPRWGDPTLEEYNFIPTADASTPNLFGMLWGEFMTRYPDRVSPEIEAFGEEFIDLSPTYSTPYPGPRTVTHGALLLDNLLIGGTTEAPTIHVVDWQTVNIGCGALDVAYFIGAGLLPDARRASERELVALWVDALAAGGVRDYSFDQAWQDYRWYTLAGFVMAVVASILVVRTERGDELFMTMAHRHGQHAMDLDALSFLRAGR